MSTSTLGLIEINVLCLNGESCMLSVSTSSRGLEVYHAVSIKLHKKGGRMILSHLDLQLIPHQTLQEQGIVGEAATLSCTYVPTDFCTACRCIKGLQVSESEFALEGLSHIKGAIAGKYLSHLPRSLEDLTFGDYFNQSMEGVTLPSGLRNLTFGEYFNQSMEGVTLPSGLQNLTFGREFDQSMEGVTLPSGLQNLTFGDCFDQSMEGVTLPSGLQNLTFGDCFNQSMEGVTLPSGLQNLKFGFNFKCEMEGVILPRSVCTFGHGSTLLSIC
eukprot:Skav203414  [mRNA]  locus=scaffold1743:285672:286487:- [translate_table: standard]